MDWLTQVRDCFCGMGGAAADTLGMSPTQYALIVTITTWALAMSFLAAMVFVFPRFRRNGFGRRQVNYMFWFVVLVALFQGFLTLADGAGYTLIRCPWETATIFVSAFFFFALAYGRHVEDGNKGNLGKWVEFVALPVLGEVGVTWIGSVRAVISFAKQFFW